MKMIKSLVVSSVLLSSVSFAGEKIVGGEPVTDRNDAPYIVSLSGSCGGSIINDSWVLTAAHCAGYFREVKGGVLNLKEQGITVGVKRVIKHPEYNRSTFSNDFALVELNQKLDLASSGLKAVKLADAEFESNGHQAPGTDATVYGYGNLGQNQYNWTEGLYKVIVPIVSHEEANRPEAYDGEVDETMLPAGYASGGKDSCQGDSGGPMVVFDHQNEPVQVGVVSWGEGCAKPNKYGVYSKVSNAHEWIQETISSK